ncbi:hypothetical protein R0290_29595 [Burkholderia semiarida]|uniref:hypothetical protein n=1 Tax=Burkholderia sp. AU44665 TaxID=3059203 RepID=UPI001CF472F8|nr:MULTISPECIES: hypothetical protein [Burkholderia]MCA8037214.1 hypothetical protein [Burkholderia arboris]MDN7702626.1 hypothetical protein [Burkholderia sp. AU44665]
MTSCRSSNASSSARSVPGGAASIASLVLTTDATVAQAPKEDSAEPASAPELGY